MKLKGRTALITSAAGEIGSATAQLFSKRGADLCLSDINDLQHVANEARVFGSHVIAIKTDLTDPIQVRHLIDQTYQTFGRINILVTVAGVASLGIAESLKEEEWDRVININLKGTWLCCQAVMACMQSRNYGRIVTIGSLVGKNGGNPRPWMNPREQEGAANVAYGASKAGVHPITLFLSKELAAHNITVNSVSPGPIAPKMTE